jgi:hypothetical protein
LGGPSDCPAPAAYTVSAFTFFNGSHNLDCYNGPDLGNNTGCYNVTTLPDGTNKSVPCESSLGPCQTCAPLCSPGAAPEPFGYGPPDRVSLTIANYKSCYHTNPGSNSSFIIGAGYGYVTCGEDVSVRFWGNSEEPDKGGLMRFINPVNCPDGKRVVAATYSVQFPLSCTYDSGRNATCTTNLPLRVPLTEAWVFLL